MNEEGEWEDSSIPLLLRCSVGYGGRLVRLRSVTLASKLSESESTRITNQWGQSRTEILQAGGEMRSIDLFNSLIWHTFEFLRSIDFALQDRFEVDQLIVITPRKIVYG